MPESHTPPSARRLGLLLVLAAAVGLLFALRPGGFSGQASGGTQSDQARVTASLVHTTGDVKLQDRDGHAREASPGAQVHVHESILVGPAGHALVVHRDGRLEPLGPDSRRVFSGAPRTRTDDPGAPADNLGQLSSRMMGQLSKLFDRTERGYLMNMGSGIRPGDAPGFDTLSPRTGETLSQRPVIRWTRAEGADCYRIELSTPTAEAPILLRRVPAHTQTLRLSEDLPRGTVVFVTIEAFEDEEMVGMDESSFVIASAQKAASIASLRAELDRAIPPGSVAHARLLYQLMISNGLHGDGHELLADMERADSQPDWPPQEKTELDRLTEGPSPASH